MAEAPLDANGIREQLCATLVGRELVVIDQTTSTNDYLAQLLASNPAEGAVVFAESQTAGRGQRGNRWVSAPGLGLWFSVLLRPQIPLSESARLTTWLAKRIAKTVEAQLALPAAVKAPNDVYIGNRKIAGVLVEMRASVAAPHVAIAGVGINVNHREHDFPAELRERAASLAMFTGTRIDRQRFAIALLRDLDRTYPALFG
jgi:BirA family biotin operon repressor/biotin-[acetyl-CoA-carboxylase] ligase